MLDPDITPESIAPPAAGLASEIKFVVDLPIAEAVRTWARTRLDPDPHGAGTYRDEYQTSSLYFDTAAHDVFHRRGSFGRSKYRVRRYDASPFAFVERKLRAAERVSKRRSLVRLEDLRWCDEEQMHGEWDAYWFHRRLLVRQLRPVCAVSYRRTARVADGTAGPIRLTIDEELRAAPVSRAMFSDGQAMPVLPGRCVVELKYCGAVPARFRELVERLALSPSPCSKYRLSFTALGLAGAPISPALVTRGQS